MRKAPIPFNPGRFDGALTELLYANWKPIGRLLKQKRKRLIRSLRKDTEDPAAQQLADKLEDCGKRRRCKSGACPECVGAAQRLLAKTARAFLRSQKGNETIVCVSIVPSDGVYGIAQLLAAETVRSIRRWKDALGRAGVQWFVGGIDHSFNEHDADRYEPHWSEHIYGFTSTTNLDQLKRNLRAQFLSTDTIPRPIKVKVWDGGTQALNYLLKPNAWRRRAFDNGERADAKLSGTRKCRDTDKQRLTSRQRKRLALHLDQLGLHGRLILRWVQFVNLGNGGPVLAKRIPKRRTPEIDENLLLRRRGRQLEPQSLVSED